MASQSVAPSAFCSSGTLGCRFCPQRSCDDIRLTRERETIIKRSIVMNTKAVVVGLQVFVLILLTISPETVSAFSSSPSSSPSPSLSIRRSSSLWELSSGSNRFFSQGSIFAGRDSKPMQQYRDAEWTKKRRRRRMPTSLVDKRLGDWNTQRNEGSDSTRSSRLFAAASLGVPDSDGSSSSSSGCDGDGIASTDTAPPTGVGSSINELLTRLLTGESASALRKPRWLSKSSRFSGLLPTWLFHLRPSVQLLATVVLYLFHTAVLTQHSVVFPFQLFPNDRGHFQSVGLDTLAGMGTLALYQYFRRQPSNFFDLEVQETSKTSETGPIDSSTIYSNTTETKANTTIVTATTTTKKTTTKAISAAFLPDLWSAPHPKNMPWKGVWNSRYSRFSSLLTLVALTRAYFFTGRFSLFWEDRLYELARHCTWMTVPMHRSLCVMLGHLSWIAMGGLILRWIPRPKPFFQSPVSQWFTSRYKASDEDQKAVMVARRSGGAAYYDDEDDDKGGAGAGNEKLTPGQLLDEYSSQQSRHPQWIWWALGGYFVSSWMHNVADFGNSYIFPVSVLEQAEENSVVAKLVNPENSDFLASLVGYIAPCIQAPWWEEILYRGYLLPTLVLLFGAQRYHLATFVSGILFSVHHQSELAFIPLCVLGWIWAVVYTKSKNLWTTIVIHCMWNSRIFLGSWFGL